MAVDPHAIPVQDAAVLTARWRKNMRGEKGGFNGAQFDRIALDKLLAQPGCAGIRIYMGMKTQEESKYPSLLTYVYWSAPTRMATTWSRHRARLRRQKRGETW